MRKATGNLLVMTMVFSIGASSASTTGNVAFSSL